MTFEEFKKIKSSFYETMLNEVKKQLKTNELYHPNDTVITLDSFLIEEYERLYPNQVKKEADILKKKIKQLNKLENKKYEKAKSNV